MIVLALAVREAPATIDAMDTLESRLDAGEWLRPGDVARLLVVSRSTVVRMLDADPPVIRYRTKPGSGGHRECHPDDVRRALDARREIHGE